MPIGSQDKTKTSADLGLRRDLGGVRDGVSLKWFLNHPFLATGVLSES